MSYEFRDDYASDSFAMVAYLDDALFDGIVQSFWSRNPGVTRVEVYRTDVGDYDGIIADQATVQTVCGHCKSRIATGAVYWTVPGIMVNGIVDEDADLQPFCKASCAVAYEVTA